MKKFGLLSLVVIFVSFSGFTKVKITYETHALISGENNEMVLTNYTGPGNPGANQTWDFSELKLLKDFTGFLETAPFTKSSKYFPNTNTELIEFGNSFFFNVNKEKIELYGYSSGCGNVKIKYDKPFIKMVYPFEYGNSFSGTFSGTYELSNIEGPINGTYNVEADGYGKLVLPNGVVIENTLRIKTIKNYNRTLSRQTSNINITTYRWYADNIRYPLLVLIQTQVTTRSNTSENFKAAYRENIDVDGLNINTLSADKSFSTNLFPIPYEDILNISYRLTEPGNILIDIYDLAGKKVKTILNKDQLEGNYKLEFDAVSNGLTKGIYHIKTTFNGRTEIKKVIQQ